MSYEYLRRLEADFQRDKHKRIWRLMKWSIRLAILVGLISVVLALNVTGVIGLLILLIAVEVVTEILGVY